MRRESVKKIRILGTVLFAAYLVLLVYLLFFAERYGRGTDAGRHINLAPLREIRRWRGSPAAYSSGPSATASFTTSQQ